jgi:NAD(P)-dependent dehydrogenase (short-subunit alcohol dehydrogenase family)
MAETRTATNKNFIRISLTPLVVVLSQDIMTTTGTKPPSLTDLIQPLRTAVVTGASSGIGKAACIKFAAAGMHVWMIDIDAHELGAAQKCVKEHETSSDQLILAEVADVSDALAMDMLAEQVFESCSACHILMNNAGIGLGGGALTDLATVGTVMGVNTFGPIHGCLAFVPRMKVSKEPGIIINTGSKQGITMPPGNLTYNMSKAALKCYTEGLEHELMMERTDGSGNLRAVLLIPGWVNTSILLKAEKAKATAASEEYDEATAFFSEQKPANGAWMPAQVVDFLIEQVDAGRFYVVCPDNDVDRKTDNLRMQWTMQDITEDRPPLSRWHPDYKDQFAAFLAANKK